MPFCVFSFSTSVLTSFGGHHRVFLAVHDQPGRRAGREEREIIEVGGRCDRNKTFDLPAGRINSCMPIQAPNEKPVTQQARASGLMVLRPIERGGRVRQFTGAVNERTLAAADAAEVETQHREAAMGEGIIALIDDLMIHRAMKLRGVWMQDHRDRRVLLLGRVITAFETGPRGR